MKEVFKTSLLGYSKKSVCQYIADMNEEFSGKILEKDKECSNSIRELKERIERLEQENEELRARQHEVAGALIDAKAFAAQLKERAEEENREKQAENEACSRAEMARIRALADNINVLQKEVHAVVRSMAEELERYDRRCQAVQAAFGQPINIEAAASAEHGQTEDGTAVWTR